jgi:hypothetical protein
MIIGLLSLIKTFRAQENATTVALRRLNSQVAQVVSRYAGSRYSECEAEHADDDCHSRGCKRSFGRRRAVHLDQSGIGELPFTFHSLLKL